MAEPPRLVLASASSARRRLLEAAGLAFEVLPADVDEAGIKQRAGAAHAAPQAIAEMLAKAKAEAVGVRRPDCVVIGADQVLALEGVIFDKPQDLEAAREHLPLWPMTVTVWDITTGGHSMWVYAGTIQVPPMGGRPEENSNHCTISSFVNEDASIEAIRNWVGVTPAHFSRDNRIHYFFDYQKLAPP